MSQLNILQCFEISVLFILSLGFFYLNFIAKRRDILYWALSLVIKAIFVLLYMIWNYNLDTYFMLTILAYINLIFIIFCFLSTAAYHSKKMPKIILILYCISAILYAFPSVIITHGHYMIHLPNIVAITVSLTYCAFYWYKSVSQLKILERVLSTFFIIWAFNHVFFLFFGMNPIVHIFHFYTNCISFFIISLTLYTVYFQQNRTDIEKIQIMNSVLETSDDFKNKYIHNFNNSIASIYGYVKLKKTEKLETYLGEMVKDYHTSCSQALLLSINEANPALTGLISSKIEYSKQKNVEFRIVIENNIPEISNEIYSVCEILGILLDNSIEAAAESESKKMYMNIKNINQGIEFSIENSLKTIPDISKIFQKGFSSKGSRRGNGLWYVDSVLRKKDNILLQTRINDNCFVVDLTILFS